MNKLQLRKIHNGPIIDFNQFGSFKQFEIIVTTEFQISFDYLITFT